MSGNNMEDFLKHLAGYLCGDEKPLSDEAIRGFLRALEEVREQDVPCSQVFSHLDEYVEKELNGEGKRIHESLQDLLVVLLFVFLSEVSYDGMAVQTAQSEWAL